MRMKFDLPTGCRTLIVGLGLHILCSVAAASLVPFDLHAEGAHGHPLKQLSAAQSLLNDSAPSRFDTTAQSDTINFNLTDKPAGGMFADDSQFPGISPGHENNFALEASAWVKIPMPGTYTFAVSSDDGFRLQVGDFSRQRTVHRPTNTYVHFVFQQAGDFPLDLTYFQHRGHAELELYASVGSFTHFMQPGADFQLVGDVADGGLELVNPPVSQPRVGAAIPEPGAIAILLVLATICLMRRRREFVRQQI
jgi:hypothetical protein